MSRQPKLYPVIQPETTNVALEGPLKTLLLVSLPPLSSKDIPLTTSNTAFQTPFLIHWVWVPFRVRRRLLHRFRLGTSCCGQPSHYMSPCLSKVKCKPIAASCGNQRGATWLSAENRWYFNNVEPWQSRPSFRDLDLDLRFACRRFGCRRGLDCNEYGKDFCSNPLMFHILCHWEQSLSQSYMS